MTTRIADHLSLITARSYPVYHSSSESPPVQVAVKEATLDSMRVVVARAEAAGSSNADALREVSVQMAELQQEYLGWQQTVLAGRLDSLKADSARIAENDRLKVCSCMRGFAPSIPPPSPPAAAAAASPSSI